MILQAVLFEWAAQSVIIPLWAFILTLLLPASFFARIAKKKINERFNNGSEG